MEMFLSLYIVYNWIISCQAILISVGGVSLLFFARLRHPHTCKLFSNEMHAAVCPYYAKYEGDGCIHIMLCQSVSHNDIHVQISKSMCRV